MQKTSVAALVPGDAVLPSSVGPNPSPLEKMRVRQRCWETGRNRGCFVNR